MIEWITQFNGKESLVFFIGLSVVVQGVEHTGVLGIWAGHLLKATGGLAFPASRIQWRELPCFEKLGRVLNGHCPAA